MTPKNEPSDYVCPLRSVDRRLEDVHQQWHQAEAAYFYPEQFRLSIQTAIQNLRTVTFILQKEKKEIPNFDAWYASWQDKLRANPLLRWMVDARNKIEKQGDLEMHSFVRAEIIASYLDEGPSIEVPAHLFDDPAALFRRIPPGEARNHVLKNGTLRIQRRWVENTLADFELLDAVAIAYGWITKVVHDAHRQMGLNAPATANVDTGHEYGDGAREGRLPCMIGHADGRALNIGLADGIPLEFSQEKIEINKKLMKKVKKRYGNIYDGIFGAKGADYETIASSLFSTARNVFLRDKYHQTMFFLFRDHSLVNFFGIRPEDHAQKYLLMRKAAHEVVKYGADAIIGLAEIWKAPADALKPYQRPVDSPLRKEALVANLVFEHHDPIVFSAEIHREAGVVRLGETRVDKDPALFSFAPIYKAWGRPVPDRWKEQVGQIGKDNQPNG